MSSKTIFTIGHSTLSYESFLQLARAAHITAIADVRTSPYSRYYPHFNREVLKEKLGRDDIAYVFLGKQLGGRPADKSLFDKGVADYEKMALQLSFKAGLKRVVDGTKKFQIALMCSEHNPLDCHRCLLVGRALAEQRQSIRHIMANGEIAHQSDIEQELLRLSGRQTKDLFASREEELAAAYRSQAKKVAFAEPNLDDPEAKVIGSMPERADSEQKR